MFDSDTDEPIVSVTGPALYARKFKSECLPRITFLVFRRPFSNVGAAASVASCTFLVQSISHHQLRSLRPTYVISRAVANDQL